MKPLHFILLVVPWLASCDPLTVHVFEPQVSGSPVRTPEAHARLTAVVQEVAKRRQLVWLPTGLLGGPDGRDQTIYYRSYHTETGSPDSLTLSFFRDPSSGTDKVKITEGRPTRSDASKSIEREIQSRLP